MVGCSFLELNNLNWFLFLCNLQSTTDNTEYQGMEDLYNQPPYISPHRIGSKKGPIASVKSRTNQISSAIDSNRQGYKQRINDVTARYFPKGSNSGGYSPGSDYNNAYLPSNQVPAPEEGYGYPYRDDNSNSDTAPSYGSYYPNDDSGYNNRGNYYYRPEYPNRYGSTNKRNLHKLLTSKRRMLSKRRKRREVVRRHVGPHDDEGLQVMGFFIWAFSVIGIFFFFFVPPFSFACRR